MQTDWLLRLHFEIGCCQLAGFSRYDFCRYNAGMCDYMIAIGHGAPREGET